MAKYRLEIFEPAAGAVEPVLRHRVTIDANDDGAAAAKAIERYEDEARSMTIAGSVLAGFVLYDGKRVVLERRRPIRSERGN
jgi:endonuclease V-like protein UPF0215 family